MAFDRNVTVYTNNIKKLWIFTLKQCIPLHHGQSFVKMSNGIDFMYKYTIIALLEYWR